MVALPGVAYPRGETYRPAYYCTDIPDENLKMIKDVCEGNSEDECEKMYNRTVAYLEKKGFKI